MVVTNSALKFNLLSILLLQFSHIYLFERFIGHLDDALFPIDGFSHFPECFVELWLHHQNDRPQLFPQIELQTPQGASACRMLHSQ